jgi:hypothetical protein
MEGVRDDRGYVEMLDPSSLHNGWVLLPFGSITALVMRVMTQAGSAQAGFFTQQGIEVTPRLLHIIKPFYGRRRSRRHKFRQTRQHFACKAPWRQNHDLIFCSGDIKACTDKRR